MTPDYKFYLMGKLRGLEKALNIVNRRSVEPATVRWLVKEIEQLRDKIGEEDMTEKEVYATTYKPQTLSEKMKGEEKE